MYWYRTGKECLALRKNILRVDLHIHPPAINNTNEILNSAKSIISAAIIKGLDVIGIVTHENSYIGWVARQISIEQNLDIIILPGEEYKTVDHMRLISYLIKEPLPLNMTFEQAIYYIHKNKGLVMIIEVTKRQSQKLKKLQNTIYAPDAIEIYNATTGGYKNIDINYPKFVGSASKTPNELEKNNVFTLISRDEMGMIGFIAKDAGINYSPSYLG